MKEPYPRRDSYFAHRFVRMLHKSCAAQDIGTAACYLVCVIAHTEDAGRYRGPARFWNSQLMETLGFKSPKQLDTARDRAMQFGWLKYERAGTRAVGEYFCTIPKQFEGLSDAPLETVATDSIHSANGKNHSSRFVPNLTHEGDGKRNANAKKSGKPSCPVPNPIPSSGPAAGARDTGRVRLQAKKLNFTPEDMELAVWFSERISALDPARTPPKLENWARDIRLMCDPDGRTYDQIKDLFERVQRDDFWKTIILSPSKLRDKWDDLRLKGKQTTETEAAQLWHSICARP